MIQLQNNQYTETQGHELQTFDPRLQPTENLRQQAREWATKLQTTYDWAEILIQLSSFSTDFRNQVWFFWQLDVFGDTD
jgi:hypothetical protein